MPAKMKTFSIDQAIDQDAPKGSAPWARAIRLNMTRMLKDAKTELRRFSGYVRLFETHLAYQQLDDAYGHPFPSMRAFCLAKQPHGLGYDPAMLEALVKETREITLGEKMAEIQAIRKLGDNQHSDSEGVPIGTPSKRGSNASTYQVARLKRDRPDIADALARGEYPSVRAAAKAAGIVHDPTPLDYLHRYWRKVSAEDRLRFLVEMLTPNERRALQRGYEDALEGDS
jgi:hypothetical protein